MIRVEKNAEELRRKDVTMIPKFRVWDKNLKILKPAAYIDWQKQIVAYYIGDFAVAANPFKKIILMKSSGLKDKNGEEIYEGDILLSTASENQEDWKKWQVHYADGRFLIDYKQIPKYKRKRKNLELEDLCEDNVWLYGLEVIGNIYENANLTELNKYKRMQRRTKMFMNLPSREVVERLREEYPEGTRVRLISMQDPYAPPRGTEGTVQGVDDAGAIMVDWDNGSGLHILYEVDVCKKI